MDRNPPRGDRAFQERPSRGILLLTSLGIVAFLLLLTYVLRHVPGGIVANPGSSSANCTLFVSPAGKDANSGTSTTSPKSLSGAAAVARPGSIVCLLGGDYSLNSSFKPRSSGTASSWIVYKNYGDGPVNIIWNGAADASAMFYLGGGSFPSNPAYLEFRGFNLDGRGNAADGFFCRGSHHLRFISNSISNTGGSGIASINCDYLTADHNVIHHNGYMPSNTAVPGDYGWTSGISFNSTRWFDSYSGFHNIISNNFVAGEYDGSSHHTDGNGIILDLSNGSYDYDSADTPPALVINNVVYGNGGRCIVAYVVTNFWMVNNTCYNNNLDPEVKNAGSLTANNSRNGRFINNIAVAWNADQPPFEQKNPNSEILYYSDLYFGASNNFVYPESSQFLEAEPGFLNPPVLDRKLPAQYAAVCHPSRIGSGLDLSPSSPAIGKGIDPAGLPKLPKNIVTDLKKYVYTDISGNKRPRGGPFDLGAYQSRRQLK